MEVNKELLRAKFKAYVALVEMAEDMVSDKELIERQNLIKEGKAPKLTSDEYCTIVADKMIEIVTTLNGGKFKEMLENGDL